MPDFFTAFIKEKSPAFFAVVALFSGCLLYLPEHTKVSLGLDEFIVEHNVWIGAAFLFSVVYLVVAAITYSVNYVRKWNAKRTRKKHGELTRKSYMENLTRDEILYLIPYLIGANSLHFREEDGIRGGLEAKDILFRSANVGYMADGFPYNIQPWALDYLNENPATYERHIGKIENPDDVELLYTNGKPWVISRRNRLY